MPVTIPTTQERIILGIDPGTTIMGYGVLRIVGNNPQLMTMGVLQLGKMGDHYLKLKRIFERVLGLIEQYHPDEMAIEAPFFGKNVQSMLKLGRAQGIAMAAALYRDIPITYPGRKHVTPTRCNRRTGCCLVPLLPDQPPFL